MIPETYRLELAPSDYIGWVAYVDGVPIYEHVPNLQASTKGGGEMAQPVAGALLMPYRKIERNCMDWKQVPYDRVQRLEIYFGREWISPRNQPPIRLDRGNPALRFIQFKRGAIIVQAGAGAGFDGGGQMRSGVLSYIGGYWDPLHGRSELWEVGRTPTPNGQMLHQMTEGHPCWPRPDGFGLGPHTVRLTEADIPPIPGANDGAAMV